MIRRTRLTLCFLGFFILFLGNIKGQEVNADNIPMRLKKNAVYGTVGFFPYFYGVYNINLERTLWDTKGFIKNIRARFGGGEWVMASWGDEGREGTHFIGTMNALTGYRIFHLELNLGIAYFHDKTNDENFVLPVSALGFRLQEPGGYFIFRLGGGYPETFYLSLGVAF